MLTQEVVITPQDRQKFAELCAQEAHEDLFRHRRGIWHHEPTDCLVVFDNNPYEGLPTRRDEELAEFRQAEGIGELAYATWPKDGERPGYTYALVLDAGVDRLDEVADIMSAIVGTPVLRMITR